MSDNPGIAALESSSTDGLRGRLLNEQIEVRFATEKDFPAIIAMGGEFASYHSAVSGPYSPQRVRATLDALSDKGAAIICVEGTRLLGFLLGIMVPVWYADTAFAVELAMWVEPGRRGKGIAGRLIQEFEKWGSEAGANFISLCDLCIEGEYPAEALFKRRGYRPIERTHILEVV